MSRSRRTKTSALAFLLFGLAAIAGSFFVTDSQTVAIAVGSTFLFGFLLVILLSTEQYVQASVHEGVYRDMARNEAALIEARNHTRILVYVPRSSVEDSATLFAPKHSDFRIPDEPALDSLFVTTETEQEEGIALSPSAASMFSEFESRSVPALSADPAELSIQLIGGLVEGFELAKEADAEVNRESDSIKFEIELSGYEEGIGFDHPIISFLGVGLANGLDRPVSVGFQMSGGGQYDLSVTYDIINE